MGEAFFSRVVDSRGGVSDLEMNHSTSPRPAEMHTEEQMVKNCNYDCIWISNVIYVVSYFLYIWNASLLFLTTSNFCDAVTCLFHLRSVRPYLILNQHA